MDQYTFFLGVTGKLGCLIGADSFTSIAYRPHRKGGEGTVFTGVFLCTGQGGGGRWSLVPVWGQVPLSILSLVLSQILPEERGRGGTSVLSRVLPGGGVSQPRTAVPPRPGQGGIPLSHRTRMVVVCLLRSHRRTFLVVVFPMQA